MIVTASRTVHYGDRAVTDTVQIDLTPAEGNSLLEVVATALAMVRTVPAETNPLERWQPGDALRQ